MQGKYKQSGGIGTWKCPYTQSYVGGLSPAACLCPLPQHGSSSLSWSLQKFKNNFIIKQTKIRLQVQSIYCIVPCSSRRPKAIPLFFYLGIFCGRITTLFSQKVQFTFQDNLSISSALPLTLTPLDQTFEERIENADPGLNI